jgi:hypothetical protein
MKLVKTFDNLSGGKCQTLEVHVDYDRSEDSVTVEKIYALESKYFYSGKTRNEDVPHAMIDLTQVFKDFFPQTIDHIEMMECWSEMEPEEDEQPSDIFRLPDVFGAIAMIVNPQNIRA